MPNIPRHPAPQVQGAQAEEARTEIAWADKPQQYGMTEDYRVPPIKTAMTQASKLVWTARGIMVIHTDSEQ